MPRLSSGGTTTTTGGTTTVDTLVGATELAKSILKAVDSATVRNLISAQLAGAATGGGSGGTQVLLDGAAVASLPVSSTAVTATSLNAVASNTVRNVVGPITLAAYNALATKDVNTLYLVAG